MTPYQQAILDALAQLALLQPGQPWRQTTADPTPYQAALERAAALAGPPARSELLDLYGDVAASRHPCSAGCMHEHRLARLLEPPQPEWPDMTVYSLTSLACVA